MIKKKIDFLFIIIASLIYSIAIPIDSEIVEHMSIINGNIPYSANNPRLLSLVNDNSNFQNLIIYFFIKNNFSPNLISYTYYFICSVISFSALYNLSKVFSKNKYINLILPLILIFYSFVNTHFYGLKYPYSYFNYSNIGTFLAILTTCFLFQKKNFLFYVFFIITSLIHFVWGAYVFIFFIFYNLLKKKKFVNSNYSAIFLFFIVFFLLNKTYSSYVKLNNESLKPNITNFETKSWNNISKSNLSSNEFHYTKRIRNIDREHFLLIKEMPNFKNILFATIKLCLALLFLLILYVKFKSQLSNEQQEFLLTSIFIFFSILILKLFDEMGLMNLNFLLLDGKQIDFARLNLTRYLNIISVYLAIIPMCIIHTSPRYDQNIKKISLIAVLFFLPFSFLNLSIFKSNFYLEKINIFNFAIWFQYFLLFFYKKKLFIKKLLKIKINYNIVFSIVFFLFFFNLFCQKTFFNNKIKKDNFVNFVGNNKSIILVSSDVIGINNFNPGLTLNTELLIPSPIYIKDNINLFCTYSNFKTVNHFKKYQKKCFEEREITEWIKIKKQTGIKFIITPERWQLKLKNKVKENVFLLYKID